MRQLEVDAEPRAFDAFCVVQKELFFSGGALGRARTVQVKRGGGNYLDLVPAHRGREPKFKLRALLVDHFGLTEFDAACAELCPARVGDHHLGLCQPQFVDRWMRLPVAALCGVSQRQHAAGFGPREALQRVGALGGKQKRLARDIGNVVAGCVIGFGGLQQAIVGLPCGDRRLLRRRGARGGRDRVGLVGLARQNFGRQNAVRIVKCGAKDLTAGDVLERGRDAAMGEQRRLSDRLCDRKAWLRRAPCP